MQKMVFISTIISFDLKTFPWSIYSYYMISYLHHLVWFYLNMESFLICVFCSFMCGVDNKLMIKWDKSGYIYTNYRVTTHKLDIYHLILLLSSKRCYLRLTTVMLPPMQICLFLWKHATNFNCLCCTWK